MKDMKCICSSTWIRPSGEAHLKIRYGTPGIFSRMPREGKLEDTICLDDMVTRDGTWIRDADASCKLVGQNHFKLRNPVASSE